jgi:predicted RecA/RadA family phage recombinase
MALNEVFFQGERISLLVGAGTVSGDPVRVGGLNAVAVTDSATSQAAGANAGFTLGIVGSANRITTGNEVGWASCKTTGIFRFPVTAAGAIAQGDLIYAIANGTGSVKKVTLTTASAGNKLFGVAFEAAASGTPTIAVKLAEISA